jgi:Uma2 family endonuclease
MATAIVSAPHAEDRSVLREISWETYVTLCDENQSRATQMAYFEGYLEIMTVGKMHEVAKGLLTIMVAAIAESLGMDFEDTGQHTFRHPSKKIGFEADLSYYLNHLAHVRATSELDLAKDPAPDLVIDVDISRNSQRKLLMYAALGIREVWRYEGATLRIYRLSGQEYETASESLVFPGVSAAQLDLLLRSGWQMPRPDWLKHVRGAVAPKG